MKNIIDSLPIIVACSMLLLIWLLPNYSLYDYLKRVQTNPFEQNKGVHVVCKNCNGTGQTIQDVNLLMAQASFAMWHNIHSNKCENCKDKLCTTAQNKYDETMNKYKEIGPKMETANCPKCMGAGSYTQYKGYRTGTEK